MMAHSLGTPASVHLVVSQARVRSFPALPRAKLQRCSLWQLYTGIAQPLTADECTAPGLFASSGLPFCCVLGGTAGFTAAPRMICHVRWPWPATSGSVCSPAAADSASRWATRLSSSLGNQVAEVLSICNTDAGRVSAAAERCKHVLHSEVHSRAAQKHA
jgi:hypothetical protein